MKAVIKVRTVMGEPISIIEVDTDHMPWPMNQACYKQVDAEEYYTPEGEHLNVRKFERGMHGYIYKKDIAIMESEWQEIERAQTQREVWEVCSRHGFDENLIGVGLDGKVDINGWNVDMHRSPNKWVRKAQSNNLHWKES